MHTIQAQAHLETWTLDTYLMEITRAFAGDDPADFVEMDRGETRSRLISVECDPETASLMHVTTAAIEIPRVVRKREYD